MLTLGVLMVLRPPMESMPAEYSTSIRVIVLLIGHGMYVVSSTGVPETCALLPRLYEEGNRLETAGQTVGMTELRALFTCREWQQEGHGAGGAHATNTGLVWVDQQRQRRR